MRINCLTCLPQACTLLSSMTSRVLLKTFIGFKGDGRVGEKSFRSDLDKMATHTGVRSFARQANKVIQNFRTDVPSTTQKNKPLGPDREARQHQQTKQLEVAHVHSLDQASEKPNIGMLPSSKGVQRKARPGAQKTRKPATPNTCVPFQRTCPTKISFALREFTDTDKARS